MPANYESKHTKFEENRASRSRDTTSQKLAQFLWVFFFFFFFFFSHTWKTCHKTRTHDAIALKFGTREKGYRAHLGTKFGVNTSINDRVINDYSRKMTPIFCHAHRANGLRYEAEIRCEVSPNIEAQTFCGLVQI